MGLRRRAGEPLNAFDWSNRPRVMSIVVCVTITQFLNIPNDQINVSHEVIVPLVGKEIVNEEMVNSLPFAKLLLSLHAECV